MRDNQERRKDLRRDAARDRRPLEREDAENILEGRNALTEALASGRAIDKVFIAEGSTDRALARLAAQAKQAGSDERYRRPSGRDRDGRGAQLRDAR